MRHLSRRTFLGQAGALALGAGFALETERILFVLMTGGPSHTDLFDFQAGSWTPDWMDPVRGFPRGLMPRLAERVEELRLVRGLRAASTDHRAAFAAMPGCDVSLDADRVTFAEGCAEARKLLARHSSVRVDFGSWDHHGNLYENLRRMCAAFDCGMNGLMNALARDAQPVRVIAMGEFGRAPGPLNQNGGRDHHSEHAALAWSNTRHSRILSATSPFLLDHIVTGP